MSLADLPVRRPVAVAMLFAALIVLGLVAAGRLPVELFPALQGDILYVNFERRGAAPEVVEREFLMPLQARVSALPQVEESSGEIFGARGRYRVRFERGADTRVRELEVGRIAAALVREQPRGTSWARVSSVQSASSAIGSFVMLVNVVGPTHPDTLFDLTEEFLAPRLAAVPGVSEAIARGGSGRRVVVRVDDARAAAAGVAPQSVIAGVRRHLGELRFVGELEDAAGRTGVLVDDRPAGIAALREGRVAAGHPARIKHVAETVLDSAAARSEYRIFGQAAVGIVLYQEQDANLVELGRELRAEVERLSEEVGTLGLRLVVGFDAAQSVEEQIGRIAQLGGAGYLIALAVLFLFLRRWRAVAVVGIAVPVSVLVALALLYVSGQTLNIISLVGISLSIGLLIDNSIVVYEAVLRRLERGLAVADAVRVGLRRTARAIAASSVTTGIVFLPTALVDLDTTGAALIEILAVSFLLPLLASLLVAVGLVPVLALRLAAPAARDSMARQRALRRRAAGLLPPAPARILMTGILASALRRPSALLATTVLAVLVTAATTLPILASGFGGGQAENADEVRFVTRTTQGRSSFDALKAAVSRVEDALQAIDGVERVVSEIDEDGASITAMLVDLEQRPEGLDTARVRAAADAAAEEIEGFELREPEEAGGGGGGARLGGGGARAIAVSGPESAPLVRLADDLVARLEAVPAVANAWVRAADGREEIWVAPRSAGIEAFGLTAGAVLPFLDLAGREGRTLDRGLMLASGRELPVVVERAGARDGDGVSELRRMRVQTARGVVPVDALASVRQMPAPPVIRHRNGRREMRVFYRLRSGAQASEAAAAGIAAVAQSVPKPPGYTVELVEEESGGSLLRKLALPAIVLIVFALAIAFESLTLPLLVLLSWPLALLGAGWLLVATGTSMTPMAAAGALVLFGLSVNPAILLVDRMQQRIRSGWSAGAAALASVRERTRPVLLTSATTIAALWPLALDTGRENEIWPPFAVLVIGGIASSAVLTLLVIPVAFTLLRRIDSLFGRIGPWLAIGWLAATLAAVLPLTLSGTVASLPWQIVVAVLIGAAFLALAAALFRRRGNPEVRLADGPPALEVRNLRKVYGLPGPFRRAVRARRDFVRRALARGGALTEAGRFRWRQAPARFGPPLILTAAPLLLAGHIDGGGWILMLWLLAAAFAGRLLTEVRRARGLGNAVGGAQPGGPEGALRVALPWLAVAGFAYWMLLAPALAGDPFAALPLWPVLAAVLLGIGQWVRASAVRQLRGRLPERAAAGPLRHARTLLRRWARRIGGLDLPLAPVQALDGVNFRIARGMVGVLGPNGAGKTTLLRQIAGILEPTRGAIYLGDLPLRRIWRAASRWIGYLPQDAGMPGGLSPRGYLAYFAALYDLPADARAARVADLLREVGIEDKADTPIKAISGGMRQRVAVARALLRLPPVIVVDEPTVGLDPRERIRLRNLLAGLARERIVLFSTHVVEDVAVACERVLVMARGRLLFDGAPAALADAAAGRVWQVRSPPGADAADALPPGGAILAEESPLPDGGSVRRLICAQRPAPDAEPAAANLEDGYLWLISGSREAEQAA